MCEHLHRRWLALKVEVARAHEIVDQVSNIYSISAFVQLKYALHQSTSFELPVTRYKNASPMQ